MHSSNPPPVLKPGGRTGLTAVVTALCFAGTLFFSPFIAAVPSQAYAPALIIVGLLMLSPVTKIPFDDFTELIPSFAVVALMSFTYNIGIGITAGFVLYPLCKLASGKLRKSSRDYGCLPLCHCCSSCFIRILRQAFHYRQNFPGFVLHFK